MIVRRFNVFINEERSFDFVMPLSEIPAFLDDAESAIIETALEELAARLRDESEIVVIHDRDQKVDSLEDDLCDQAYETLVISKTNT